jgi:hypothetical protein
LFSAAFVGAGLALDVDEVANRVEPSRLPTLGRDVAEELGALDQVRIVGPVGLGQGVPMPSGLSQSAFQMARIRLTRLRPPSSSAACRNARSMVMPKFTPVK